MSATGGGAAAAASKPATAGPAFAPVLKVGLQATASRVEEMHLAISGKTFDALQQVPGLSVPARLVQGVHDAISQGVYGAVRHGGGAALAMAGLAEQIVQDPSRIPAGKELAVRSALNGVFGDALADMGSALAVTMGFYLDGGSLPLTPDALRGVGERVCIFIHGLACDEHSWVAAAGAWDTSTWAPGLAGNERPQYGSLLRRELGITPIYLRYNTGLPIADNALALAEQLEQLVLQAPPGLRELVLVGHSMGGLVARGACEFAAACGHAWLNKTPMLICLGTPHQGALLERLGHVTSLALAMSKVTQPLGRIADARSQGIKDLRHGVKRKKVGNAGPSKPVHQVALRFVAASLGDEPNSMLGSLVGRVLGDGLVTPRSASDDGLEGDVQRVELAGLGHMALLNHPKVYALIRAWLGAPALD